MTKAQKDYAEAVRAYVIVRSGGRCEHTDEDGNRDCQNPGVEQAHMIAKSKMNLQKYGPEIVHHPKLIRWSCKKHNDSFNIGFKPEVCRIKVAEIKDAGIENWR